MKKITICFTSAMVALSLAACTPTPVKQEQATSMPDIEMSTGGASDKVPDPNVEPMEIVSIYSVNKEATGLNQAMDAVVALDAQSIVDKMIEYGVLEEGTEAISFEIKNKMATLNLSQVPTVTGTEEKMLLTSIGNTFTENFELDQIKLLVDGKNYTGDQIKQKDSDNLTYNKDYQKN